MRIAFDVTCRPGEGTGIGVFAAELAEALGRRSDLELVPLHPPSGRMTTARRLWWDQVGVPRAAAAASADLIHHAGFTCSAFAAAPRVVTLHDFLPLDFPEEIPGLGARLFYHHLLPRSLSRAARIVAVSEATRADLARRLPALAARTTVIHEALPASRAAPPSAADRARVRAAHGLDVPYVLAVASELPRKGLPGLVRAFSSLKERPLALALAGGPGPDTAAVTAAIQASGGADRIRRLGRVPTADLPALYAEAEVFAFPSLGEGFGLPPLEAMAQGTPVVCSRGTSLPEVVGDAAVLVDPGDEAGLAAALADLLGDPDRRAQLAARGRRRAAARSFDDVAAEYAAVYRDLLGPGRG